MFEKNRRQTLLGDMDACLPSRLAPGGDNREEIRWMRQVLRAGIDHCLTPRQREVVRLYYYKSMTMPLIAGELGLNVSTVSRHLKAARGRLEHFARQMELFLSLKSS